ncbi:MAG TPA: 8-amino-7-oxononanoate synthase [Myxococcaceae bacterium]|nr:8-amino-7-oxononanoate synthase [Myxococcaceae bacterium]
MSSVADAWAREELAELGRRGLLRTLEPLASPQGPVVRIGGQSLVNFSSNDYLGLAADPRVTGAFIAGLERWGVGAGASRLVVGDTEAHRRLEARLAAFEGTEAALIFNGGYPANLGLVQALVGRGDLVVSDALNHASLVDGCRLSRAEVAVVPHADVAAVATALARAGFRRKLVVTDAVFSMDGDSAPLEELSEVCARAGAALLVDEAHATGVLGARGSGLCEATGVQPDVRMGTLGKALGGFGAYAATTRAVADFLVNRARSVVFSTTLPPALCEALVVAIDVLEADPELRPRLWRNIRRFVDGLGRIGFEAEPRSAIVPVILGAPERALRASAFLRERGLLVKPIRPPTVPEGTSRLRFALSAAHSEAQIDGALQALEEARAHGLVAA